jgi:hypothetical protein
MPFLTKYDEMLKKHLDNLPEEIKAKVLERLSEPQPRKGMLLGGLHLEDLPRVVKEIADLMDASIYAPHQPDVRSVTVKFGWEWPEGDDHHVFLEIVDVDRGESRNTVTLSRVFCENCGGVFYIPVPPACFPGNPPAYSCPYCLGESLRILERVTTVVQAEVPAPRGRR